MFKHTATYIDFNGIERTEDFYFNLSAAEVAEKELRTPGGYGEYLTRIANGMDQELIMDTWKSFILESYGEKSADGRKFVKGKDLSEAFSQTAAYSDIYIKLLTDTEFALDFVQGVLASVEKADLGDSGQNTVDKAKALIEARTAAKN